MYIIFNSELHLHKTDEKRSSVELITKKDVFQNFTFYKIVSFENSALYIPIYQQIEESRDQSGKTKRYWFTIFRIK